MNYVDIVNMVYVGNNARLTDAQWHPARNRFHS